MEEDEEEREEDEDEDEDEEDEEEDEEEEDVVAHTAPSSPAPRTSNAAADDHDPISSLVFL